MLTAIIKFWSKFHIQILCHGFTRDNKFLLTPSQPLPGKQENPSSSASRHVKNCLKVYFFLDYELSNGSNGRMKVQVKTAFKGYLFCHQKTKRKQIGSAWNLLQPSNTSVQRCLYPLFQNRSSYFCCFIFFEECLNLQVRINKTLNEHTVDYHPSPSELTLGIHPVIFLWTPKRFISPEYFLIFVWNLYILPWLKKMLPI